MPTLKSSKSESDVKRAMIESMKLSGGYGRRIEDQYAVGVFDTLLIPKGLPCFMAEVKVIRGTTFGPTDRQWIELMRVKEADAGNGHSIPILIGWKEGVHYFHPPAKIVNCSDCFYITDGGRSFEWQLAQFYFAKRGELI